MKRKITIASPMYSGQCSGLFAESLAAAMVNLPKLNIEVNYLTVYNESLITRARNLLTEEFLRSDSEYLLFIDADQYFDYKDIYLMLCENKEILGAAVPLKAINWTEVVKAVKNGLDPKEHTAYYNYNTIDNKPIKDKSKVFEVKYIGTGMLLIKREVFEKISNFVPVYKNNSNSIYSVETGHDIKEFFATSIDNENHLLSEDFHFCSLAKKQGYKIYCVSYPTIKHAGTYFFK